MSDLELRLRTLFNERSVRRLAPASLLAVSCGVALGGVAVGAPALASGIGQVIGNIAVNIASGWIERLVILPVEAEAERIELIEQGLEARDPGTLAVVAATLAEAGPQLAAALPEEARPQLAASLGQGMTEAGGPLSALAPTYTTALQTPDQADWAAIRAQTQQQIQISARIEAAERATIERSGITITTTGMPIDASVIAQADSTIRESGIHIGDGASPPPPVAPPPHAPPTPRSLKLGPTADHGGQVNNSPTSYIERADHVTVHGHDPEAARRASDLRAYLQRTFHDCNALPLDKIDQTDTSYIRAMELARVYIALDTTASVELEANAQPRRRPDPEKQRPLSAVEALARAPNGRMLLLGAPGSGKSTFANYLTYCLTGSALAERQTTQLEPEGGWLSLLPGWAYGALLPVPIILRDLAALPELTTLRRGTVAQITTLLAANTAEMGCPHANEPLLAALREGRALLLLDGLDEVVGTTVLPRVAEAIIDAAKTFPGPILVTCRVLDYQEERLRQLPGFAPFTLADLRPEQIDQFIAAWYTELAASGRRTRAVVNAASREMQGAVQSRDELRALASTPLLLTLMAQVHAFRGTLPDARALLYFACIELLLLRWRQPRDEPDLIIRLGLSRFGNGDLLSLMAHLGFEAHRRAERDGSTSGPADMSEGDVLHILSATFKTYDPQRCAELAGIVLQALERGNGLLLKRGPQRYTFAHRTFQEFLAGYHLKGQRNALPICREHAQQIHWHEALLLMVGYQVLGEQELEKPLQLAEKLLAEGGQLEHTLAGEVLALVGKERAKRYDPALVAPGGLWQRSLRSLRSLQSSGQAPEAPATLRHRAGLALGRLCYGELNDLASGAAPPNADPRLPLAVIGTALGGTPNWRKALHEHYWCAIAPGPFWSGDDRQRYDDDDDSNPLQRAAAFVGRAVAQVRSDRHGALERATIHTPYRIARYPITNADYACFLAANGPDGYEPTKPWWTEQGRTYLLPGGFRFGGEPQQITHPRFWSVARYNNPMQPVVGVSWYEAAAYCRWLTQVGWDAGWLPHNQIIRLPTWHEWERAARHTDPRRYPWGDTAPNPELVNYQETQLNAPSPIGCFPRGASVDQVQDLVGNVLEWTASPWEQWHKEAKDFTPYQQVTLSYTYFNDSTDELCCGARGRLGPFIRLNRRGFRVLQSLRAH
ncbi:MAG: NACHT domain-containing protein [Oscillochloridaceae bacterium umkhey_bin13]